VPAENRSALQQHCQYPAAELLMPERTALPASVRESPEAGMKVIRMAPEDKPSLTFAVGLFLSIPKYAYLV
jgi:hypothetical protein